MNYEPHHFTIKSEQVKRNILAQTSNSDELTKGDVSELLYDNTLKLPKKGFEIIACLEKQAALKESRTKECLELIKVLGDILPEKPTEKIGVEEGLLEQFPFLAALNSYNYDLCNWNESCNNNYNTFSSSANNTSSATEIDAKNCQAYNNAVWKIRNYCEQYAQIQALLKSFKPEVEYMLTPRQIVNLEI